MEWVSPEKLAEVAAEARERWNVPGLAVGVLRDGEIVTAADGQQELGRPERVTPETVFRIASITKPFTATLAMTLVQEGLLALDEPPPGTHVEATVRQARRAHRTPRRVRGRRTSVRVSDRRRRAVPAARSRCPRRPARRGRWSPRWLEPAMRCARRGWIRSG